ncbi:MAG TPA: TetR/AcrR family transcriptional regulator, partial [Myxococcota bacterium]|nr:TetR/AcrR family transcriptional regulator [Myxococcota bacterium]
WRNGYEGTSLHDLTDAMGINPPSLYAAFGDKEHLYLEAVERYQRWRREQLGRVLDEEPTARGALERLLRELATELSKSCYPSGCLLAMSASCTSASAHAQEALAERRSQARRRLKERIDRGVRDGDVAADTDTGALADFYTTVVTGMSMRARDGASRRSLLATVDAAMRAWPLPAPGAAKRKPARVTA